VLNLYVGPRCGDAKAVDAPAARPWIELLCFLFGEHSGHIQRWLAHRVQRPWEKVNHGIVLGGSQGIGKDSLLAPLEYAVGPWNVTEVSPREIVGRFNGFRKSVVLRVSEVHDLGDTDRFSFYESCKTLLAAPPNVLRVDEKNLREHQVPNTVGVVFTTNFLTGGMYLPSKDRRHFVAWSDREQEEFDESFFPRLHEWYENGGLEHVAAYLRGMDLSDFNPKAPPKKTAAWWAIVGSNKAPETGPIADCLEQLGTYVDGVAERVPPDAVTIDMLIDASHTDELANWLKDHKNRRIIGHRLHEAGYISVPNRDAESELWRVKGKRVVIYARRNLSFQEQVRAARELQGR
jgi:Family of unknown function (DUF5906)